MQVLQEVILFFLLLLLLVAVAEVEEELQAETHTTLQLVDQVAVVVMVSTTMVLLVQQIKDTPVEIDHRQMKLLAAAAEAELQQRVQMEVPLLMELGITEMVEREEMVVHHLLVVHQ
jgi:hypothetical protein